MFFQPEFKDWIHIRENHNKKWHIVEPYCDEADSEKPVQRKETPVCAASFVHLNSYVFGTIYKRLFQKYLPFPIAHTTALCLLCFWIIVLKLNSFVDKFICWVCNQWDIGTTSCCIRTCCLYDEQIFICTICYCINSDLFFTQGCKSIINFANNHQSSEVLC